MKEFGLRDSIKSFIRDPNERKRLKELLLLFILALHATHTHTHLIKALNIQTDGLTESFIWEAFICSNHDVVDFLLRSLFLFGYSLNSFRDLFETKT